MYVYIYIYICIYVCIYICMYTYTTDSFPTLGGSGRFSRALLQFCSLRRHQAPLDVFAKKGDSLWHNPIIYQRSTWCLDRWGRECHTETKFESETPRSKSGTSVNLNKSGVPCPGGWRRPPQRAIGHAPPASLRINENSKKHRMSRQTMRRVWWAYLYEKIIQSKPFWRWSLLNEFLNTTGKEHAPW